MPDQVILFFNQNLAPLVGFKMQPFSMNQPKPQPSASVTLDDRHVHGEFIRELFKVVLRRDVRGENEFDKYMNVLNQGGHLEGIYNGIVYSQEYRQKETGVATVTALKAYAELMAQIKLDQKYDTLRIPKPEDADVPVPNSDDVQPPQPSNAEREALKMDLEHDGMAKSLFTLKRKLGEEVLKTIDLKREYKEKFATWYGHYCAFFGKRGLDFGLVERNNPSDYFHYRWALDADEDRLKWEALNRVHVFMNAQQPERMTELKAAPLMVLYEDASIVCFNKPAGLPTQPTLDPGRPNLFDLAKAQMLETRGSSYLGLHHRLDRDTSGVVLFTVDRKCNAFIGDQFKDHKCSKTYVALVHGKLKKREGHIESFMGEVNRRGKQAQHGSMRSGGKKAITDYVVLRANDRFSLVEVRITTGRTHQIRVHMSEMGHPVVGDTLYGSPVSQYNKYGRFFLHAHALTITHPETLNRVRVESPIPPEFTV